MSRKIMNVEDAQKVWNHIEEIDLDSLQPVTQERLFLSNFANALRPALKKLGITNRMVGVVVPNYSLCSMIEVNVPAFEYRHNFRTIKTLSDEQREAYHSEVRALEDHRRDACSKLSRIILRLFPGCDDRSDVMTDYFDSRFTCY